MDLFLAKAKKTLNLCVSCRVNITLYKLCHVEHISKVVPEPTASNAQSVLLNALLLLRKMIVLIKLKKFLFAIIVIALE